MVKIALSAWVLLVILSSTAIAEVVFQDNFENGLDTSLWEWPFSNWGGTKQIVSNTLNTNTFGSKSLYMAGSDTSPGGCSYMQTKQIFSLSKGQVDLYFRNISQLSGSGNDGHVGIDLYSSTNEFIGMYRDRRNGSGGDGMYSWGGYPGWEYYTPRLPVSSNWNKLTVAYDHGPGWSQVDVKVTDGSGNVTTILSSRNNVKDYGNLGRVVIGVGGQYNNTGSWTIDNVSLSGESTVTPPPAQATSPNPNNTETNVSLTTDLSWISGSGATSHDVYFGTVNPPPFICNQTGTIYDTGTMSPNTTYYWRIDEKNKGGCTTGLVWRFTTTTPIVSLPKIKLYPTVGANTIYLNWSTNESTFGNYFRYKIAVRPKDGNDWSIFNDIEGVTIQEHQVIIQEELGLLDWPGTYEIKVVAYDDNLGKEISQWSNIVTVSTRTAFTNIVVPRPYPIVLVPGMGARLEKSVLKELRHKFSDLGWGVANPATVEYINYQQNATPSKVKWYNDDEPDYSDISVFTFVPFPSYDNANIQEIGIAQKGIELGYFLKHLGEKDDTKTNFQLVSHSLGGLTCRAYLQRVTDPMKYRNNVGRLVTTSTPNNGVCPDVIYQQGSPYHYGDFVTGLKYLMINYYCTDPLRNCYLGGEITAKKSIEALWFLLSAKHWDVFGDTIYLKTDVFKNSVFMSDLRDPNTGEFCGFSPDIKLVSVVNKTETSYQGLPFDSYNKFMGYETEGGGDGFVGINSQNLTKIFPGNDKIRAIERYKTKQLNHIEAGDDFCGIMMALGYPVLSIKAKCPVDLEITSPSGAVISKNFTNMFLAEYSENPEGNDPNDLSDTVEIPFPEIGEYTINVIPDPNADPDDTYSLIATQGEVSTVLADNVRIANIPLESYVVVTSNTKPVVNAGPDQTVPCVDPTGTEVQLDGSGSMDPDGDELTYEWTWDGGSAEGVNPIITLPMGTTTVTLTVSDGLLSDTDTVDITVADMAQPKVTAVIINDGQPQRSMLQNVKIRFSEPVNVGDLINFGIIDEYVGLYNITQSYSQISWLDETRFQWDSATNTLSIDLTVDGFGGSSRTKLADGRYVLYFESQVITDDAGNCLIDEYDGFDRTITDGQPAASQDFFRFFGDSDGNAAVNAADMTQFSKSYLKTASSPLYNAIFDADGDGDVDYQDQAAFRKNYGKTLP